MTCPPYPVNVTSPNASAPPVYEEPVSKVELRCSCRNLMNMDLFSKSDPFIVVYTKSQSRHATWVELGRTETIWDNLNPDFVKSFVLDYYLEQHQKMMFEVYDNDDEHSRNLKSHDFLGRVITSLGSIVGEHCGRCELFLQTGTVEDYEKNIKPSKNSAGTLIVRAEEINNNRDVVTLDLCGKKLDKKDWFGKSDPYLEFQRSNEDNTYTVVHRTEVIMNTLDPVWKPFTIPVQVLCNGDYDRNLQVYCYDWNSNGKSELIGVFEVTLNDLKGYKTGRPQCYDIFNINDKGKKAGSIHIQECIVQTKPSFLDYITGGLVLNFVVAIDLTASNGMPSDPNSLHYSSANTPSQYVQILQAIGTIIEDYDADKLFPSFGFGAKLPPAWNVSHDFALNFNPQDPHCCGVQGIIDAYIGTVGAVQLYGPTNFAPVINSCSRIARSIPPGSQYFVLLIITDGIISDMNQTKQAIINAAVLPISIIIVGVGNADFDAMEELDGDDVRVNLNGNYAARDIVQFVPFRDYTQYNIGNRARLAKDVLHELPGQVVEYMENKLSPRVNVLEHSVSRNYYSPFFLLMYFIVTVLVLQYIKWIFNL